jgi:hypothetical protein
MLSIPTTCLSPRLSRRSFLRVGTLGGLGWTLADLLALRAQAAPHRQDRSVVFVFQIGGPSQHECFDPKPNAPEAYRTMAETIPTSLPDVAFAEFFPQLARRANRLAVIRSFVPGNANHEGGSTLFTQGNPKRPSLPTLFARLAGATHPQSGLPSSTYLSPQSVGQPLYKYNRGAFDPKGVFLTGKLGEKYKPFELPSTSATAGMNPARDGNPSWLDNMRLHGSAERFTERRELLRQLDGLRQQFDAIDPAAQLDEYQRQAYDIVLRSTVRAFDLSQEDPKTLRRYDTSHIRTSEKLVKSVSYAQAFSPDFFGKQMLLARRLCEAGCGFVTVGMLGWDHHGLATPEFSIPQGMPLLGAACDHALSAFLEDVEERGLSERILLVMAGEMGRTPKIDGLHTERAGRGHWKGLGSLLLAGGGLRMGQVIGASDRLGGEPVTRPITPQSLAGTVLHTLFDLNQLRAQSGQFDDTSIQMAAELPTIPELM